MGTRTGDSTVTGIDPGRGYRQGELSTVRDASANTSPGATPRRPTGPLAGGESFTLGRPGKQEALK